MPLSLSSIGRKFVRKIWEEERYEGYQISQKYLLGNVASTLTPKGWNFVRRSGCILPLYIANYKGGRKECFMYGIDRETEWFDYDLTSAYTTVMSAAGDPDYKIVRRLTEQELQKLTKEEILYSYLIIQVLFEFPSSTKYPSIPCFVDENCTIFPLTGEAVLTGSEFILAKSQGCKFVIHIIPFKKF